MQEKQFHRSLDFKPNDSREEEKSENFNEIDIGFNKPSIEQIYKNFKVPLG